MPETKIYDLHGTREGDTMVYIAASPMGAPAPGSSAGSGGFWGAQPPPPPSSAGLHTGGFETVGKRDEVRPSSFCAALRRVCAYSSNEQSVALVCMWRAGGAMGSPAKQSMKSRACDWHARRLCALQVIKLRAALNEKDMELIELREQHMQLVVSCPWR